MRNYKFFYLTFTLIGIAGCSGNPPSSNNTVQNVSITSTQTKIRVIPVSENKPESKVNNKVVSNTNFQNSNITILNGQVITSSPSGVSYEVANSTPKTK